ncbi:MAG: anion permease [Chloroflexi bacterium]|nr:anion permease [Chloroflexota bacterium]
MSTLPSTAQQSIPTAKPKRNWVHILGAAGAVIVYIIVQSLHFTGLTPQGQGMLALLLAAVVLWITQPIPMAYTSLLLVLIPWMLGYIKPEVAFGAFSGTTFWLVFGVLAMGSCVAASPFSRRICLMILSLIGKPTFKRVLAVSFVMMLVLGYFIPATTAKIAVLFAILLPIVVLFGVQTKSRIGTGLAISIATIGSVTMIATPTAGSITAMAYGVLTKGGVNVSFTQWALIALIPVVAIFLLYYLFVSWYIKPEAKEAIGGREKVQEDLKALPPMSIKEIWVLVVTVGILVGWLAGLNSTMVVLVGVLLYVLPGIGVMSFSNLISKGVHWETLIFLGTVLALGPMLGAVGLTEFFTGILSAPFAIATNPFMFVVAMVPIMLLVVGTMIHIPSIPLFVPILIEMGPLAGVSPILGVMMYMSMWPQFFFWFIAPNFAMAKKDDIGNVKDWIIMSAALFVIEIIVWAAYVYIAPALGLIPA